MAIRGDTDGLIAFLNELLATDPEFMSAIVGMRLTCNQALADHPTVHVNEDFDKHCKTFAITIGHATNLQLGWGVVRGAVKVLEKDYVGSNLNKSARLCDVARPFGIVTDRDDFTTLPSIGDLKFVTRERLRETPEVHIAGMCIDTNDRRGVRVLIARRVPTRRLYPGLYEGCGGQLARSETFCAGVERHFRLEMGMSISVDMNIHCFYVIKEADEPLIPGIRFLCHRVGDAEPSSPNHSEIRWVFEQDLRNMDATLFIPGLKDDFLELLDKYHRANPVKA
jgi:hypothetical protein